MTLSDYRLRFDETLSGHFEAQELSSIFFLGIHHFLNIERYQLNEKKEVLLTKDQQQELFSLIERLEKAEPIQYILGETAFYGLTFNVDKNVLIPRPETEELVDLVIQESKHENQGLEKLKILDIGTGSGCIAISLAKNLPKVEVLAIDVSSIALKVAQENANTNKVDNVEFIEKDILLTNNSFFKSKDSLDVIVSNPPYVRQSEKVKMKPNVVNNEPHLALFVEDEDALQFYSSQSFQSSAAFAYIFK